MTNKNGTACCGPEAYYMSFAENRCSVCNAKRPPDKQELLDAINFYGRACAKYARSPSDASSAAMVELHVRLQIMIDEVMPDAE